MRVNSKKLCEKCGNHIHLLPGEENLPRLCKHCELEERTTRSFKAVARDDGILFD